MKMKEIVVISGKGGTGKTSLTAAFAGLADQPVLADCDVDAADLHLILKPVERNRTEFFSGRQALIDEQKCINCGACLAHCRYEAIHMASRTGPFSVRPSSCEGCGVCVRFCPVAAIEFPARRCGEWSLSGTRFGSMVHARLRAGGENSGKLVSLVRSEARKAAQREGAELVLIDGPPGVGCPVIASVTGCDDVIVVAEPTLSGCHDLARIYELAGHFGIPVHLVTNKWDINPGLTGKIEGMTRETGGNILGRVPFDRAFTRAQIEGKTILEYAPQNSELDNYVKEAWDRLWSQL